MCVIHFVSQEVQTHQILQKLRAVSLSVCKPPTKAGPITFQSTWGDDFVWQNVTSQDLVVLRTIECVLDFLAELYRVREEHP